VGIEVGIGVEVVANGDQLTVGGSQRVEFPTKLGHDRRQLGGLRGRPGGVSSPMRMHGARD
jgi:hypothetical protein